MSNDELFVQEMERAIYELHGLEPGTEEYMRQAQVIKLFNEIVREREKAADEYDEKNSKQAKKERRQERLLKAMPWLSNLLLGGGIMLFEGNGNFIKTKAFSQIIKPR